MNYDIKKLIRELRSDLANAPAGPLNDAVEKLLEIVEEGYRETEYQLNCKQATTQE